MRQAGRRALFALEVILGEFGVSQFSPIVISSVVSTIVTRSLIGDRPAFIVPSYELVSAYEMLPYAILGLAAGVVGVVFTFVLYKAEDTFDALPIPDLSKPVLGGLIIGSISLAFPQILGVGYEATDMALAGEMAWYLMMGLILIKVTATSITIGSGGSGGVFAPSLFLGAMTGGVVNLTDNNMSAPLLARSFGTFLFAMISAIAFATVLGTVSGLIIAASGAVAHDVLDRFAGVIKDDRQKVAAGKVVALTFVPLHAVLQALVGYDDETGDEEGRVDQYAPATQILVAPGGGI